jgi:hypothetical protein
LERLVISLSIKTTNHITHEKVLPLHKLTSSLITLISFQSELRSKIAILTTEIRTVQSTQKCAQSKTNAALARVTSDVTILKAGLDSLIRADVQSRRLEPTSVSDFLAIFREFEGKQFRLLWRGGRDGFGAREFHDRCNGRAKTLTVISDRNGNVFGGFTPVPWES